MTNNPNPVEKAIAFFGRAKISEITGVSRPAVSKWERNGHFPHTDYSGKTHHARKLADASNGHFTIEDLLPQVSK